jgi:hypothetical protein
VIENFTAKVRSKTKRGAFMSRGGENFAFTVTDRQDEIQPKLKVCTLLEIVFDRLAYPLQDNNDGSYTATWVPIRSGAATFAVTVNNKPIQGSPWTEKH